MAIQFSYERIMGMTASEIIKKVDVSNLDSFTRAQKAAIVNKVGTAMNRRRRSLKKLKKEKDVYSAAYESVKKSKYFSVKGKGDRALKTEFRRIKEFGSAQSSTVKGAKAINKAIRTRARKSGIPITSGKQVLDIGSMWQDLKDNYPEVVQIFKSEQIDSTIYRNITKGTPSTERILNDLTGKKRADELRAARAERADDIFEVIVNEKNNPFT